MSEVTYMTESLIGGEIKTQQSILAADTYYKGMPLQYNFTVPTEGTADVGNTGDGTMTGVTQGVTGQLKIGTYEVKCVEVATHGGTFSLADPNGNLLATDLTIFAGAGEVTEFAIGGLVFSITDGATDFVAGDKFTLAITAGAYAYLAGGQLAGFFLEDESRIISSAAAGSIIIGGEIQEGGIVDDSGDALTITEDMIVEWAALGFYVKRS